MKKIISCLLSVAIVLSLCPLCLVVSAAENNKFTNEYFQVYFDKTTVAPGEEFTLTAYFAADSDLDVSSADLVVRGSNITSDLHIVIYKDEATGYTATGSFIYATMNPDPISYYEGDSVTFSLEVEPGWQVNDVAARWRTKNQNNGTWIYHSIPATQNEDGTYTIEGLPAYDVEISAASYTPLNWVEVNTYLELDDMTIFLVKMAGKGVEEGNPYAYDGNPMYRTDKYTVEAWEGPVLCWLVAVPKGEEALTAEAAQEKIAYLKTDIIELDQSGDVNMTGKVDINDAQLVYDMYQGVYSDFNTVSVLKFLNADVNGSGTLNSDDAVAIINSMQNK